MFPSQQQPAPAARQWPAQPAGVPVPPVRPAGVPAQPHPFPLAHNAAAARPTPAAAASSFQPARSPSSSIPTIDLTGLSPSHALPAASSPTTVVSSPAMLVSAAAAGPLSPHPPVTLASAAALAAAQVSSSSASSSSSSSSPSSSTIPLNNLPASFNRRPRQIVVLLDSGFGLNSAINELLDLLKAILHPRTFADSVPCQFSLIQFASNASHCDGGTQESPFTPSLIVFTHWLQALNTGRRGCIDSGCVSLPLHLALRKFARNPPPDGQLVDRYVLLFSNSYPDDWPHARHPLSTAAAVAQCKAKNIALSCWSTREIPHFEQMVAASTIEQTPPKITRLHRRRTADHSYLFSALSFPPFWAGQLSLKLPDGTVTFRLAARASHTVDLAALKVLSWFSEFTIDTASFHHQPVDAWNDYAKDKPRFYLLPFDAADRDDIQQLLRRLRSPPTHVAYFNVYISRPDAADHLYLNAFTTPTGELIQAFVVPRTQVAQTPAAAAAAAPAPAHHSMPRPSFLS